MAGCAGAERTADGPGRHVRAERIEGTVRQVDDAHHAINQAETRGDEKQNGGVEDGVEDLYEEDVHRSLRSARGPCADAKSHDLGRWQQRVAVQEDADNDRIVS